MGRSKESKTQIDLSLKLDSRDDHEDGHEYLESHSNIQQAVHVNIPQDVKESHVDVEAKEEDLDDIHSPRRISQIHKDLKTQEVLAPKQYIIILY